MSVRTKHPDYEKMLEGWRVTSACCNGVRAVLELGPIALPPPDEHVDQSGNVTYDTQRYDRYKRRATYVNVTGRTKMGMKGAAFRFPTTISIQESLSYMESDCDGSGTSLERASQQFLASLLMFGRDCVLVDYFEAAKKAYFKRYVPTSLINWKEEYIDGSMKLTLAVLEESESVGGEFDHKSRPMYRVLRLTDGVYTQQEYRQKSDGAIGYEWIAGELVTPLDYNGNPLDRIPLVVFGSETNDAKVDPIPLEDIAWVNLAHFRNSADLEENCSIHGQLTLGVSSSLSYDEFEKANPSGILVGAMKGHFLGERGGFTSVQAGANQLADRLMERKERQMVMLGARLIEKGNPNTTATTAKIDATGENSVLDTIVTNTEAGVNTLLELASLYMGEEKPSTIKMNRDFFPETADSQMVMAAIQLYDRRAIAKSDLQGVAKDNGILAENRTPEEIESDLEDIDTEQRNDETIDIADSNSLQL